MQLSKTSQKSTSVEKSTPKESAVEPEVKRKPAAATKTVATRARAAGAKLELDPAYVIPKIPRSGKLFLNTHFSTIFVLTINFCFSQFVLIPRR
jgi:hypothetical protein